jgi:predicted RNase H-like HicB family nuclease
MTFRVLVHAADEGGFWAEVPALPGCFTHGATLEEVRARAEEAIHAYLDSNDQPVADDSIQVLEIAV